MRSCNRIEGTFGSVSPGFAGQDSFGAAEGAEAGDVAAPLGAPDAPRAAAAAGRLRLPQTVEPADVVSALLENSDAAGTPLSASLWIADAVSDELRLVHSVASADIRACVASSRAVTSGLVEAHSAQRATLEVSARAHGCAEPVWRYAFPLVVGEESGVAAIDLVAATPDETALGKVAGTMRAALSGALALYLARAEVDVVEEVIESSRELVIAKDTVEVAEAALTRAMTLFDGDSGSLMLVNGDGRHMHIVASRGIKEDVVRRTLIGEGEGIAGWVLASGNPLVIEDVPGTRSARGRADVRSAVCVPVVDDDGVIGVISVGRKAFGARPSRERLEALESLGRLTCVALRRVVSAEEPPEDYFDAVKVLAQAMEAKGECATEDSTLVAKIAVAIGRSLGLPEREVRALRFAAVLRDVGMSVAGDAMAASARPLSTVEWGMVKMHPIVSRDIVKGASVLGDVAPIVYYHHERFDGSGYVAGLAGEDIPLGARILAVADAYVAMTSDRPYRPARSPEAALLELAEHTGTQFDPAVVLALVEIAGEDPDALLAPDSECES